MPKRQGRQGLGGRQGCSQGLRPWARLPTDVTRLQPLHMHASVRLQSIATARTHKHASSCWNHAQDASGHQTFANVGKESRLKSMSIRHNLAVRRGNGKDVIYRCACVWGWVGRGRGVGERCLSPSCHRHVLTVNGNTIIFSKHIQFQPNGQSNRPTNCRFRRTGCWWTCTAAPCR